MIGSSSSEIGLLVSIIVPAWNAEATLLETLLSAARQTHRELEILIVDDGSTDQTARIAREFCEWEKRARLVRKFRGGLASARNRGIDEARGDWIAPLDADDLWHPEKLERQLQTIASRPEHVGLAYCWYRVIDEAGRVTERPWGPVIEGMVVDQHLRLNFGTGSSPLIRRSALGELRYSTELSTLTEGGSEDWLLQLQIAARSEIACTRAFLLGYRRRCDSMSADTARMVRSYIGMYEILRREMPNRARLIQKELAYWRATYAMERWRDPSARAIREIAAVFRRSPRSGAKAIKEQLARRFSPFRASSWLRTHPSVGRSFFAMQPEER